MEYTILYYTILPTPLHIYRFTLIFTPLCLTHTVSICNNHLIHSPSVETIHAVYAQIKIVWSQIVLALCQNLPPPQKKSSWAHLETGHALRILNSKHTWPWRFCKMWIRDRKKYSDLTRIMNVWTNITHSMMVD